MGTRQGVVVGVVASALGVLAARPLAGTAALLPPTTTPTVTVPPVTTPTVRVPPVTTPVGTTPSVTTPTPTTPTVTTPRVTTPTLTTPALTTPSVRTPVATVPSGTVPATAGAPVTRVTSTASSLVDGVTRQAAGTSGAAGVPASAAPDVTAPASSAGPAGSGAPARASPAATASPTVATDSHAELARSRARTGPSGTPPRRSARDRRLAAARESRRLRRLVARLRGCLRTLEAGARRLLSLRAGLDGPARSRAGTARILRVSVAREGRLERRAVRALRRSAVTGCAAAAAPSTSGSTAATAPTWASPSRAAAPSGPSASLSAAHAERSPRAGRTSRSRPAPHRRRPGADRRLIAGRGHLRRSARPPVWATPPCAARDPTATGGRGTRRGRSAPPTAPGAPGVTHPPPGPGISAARHRRGREHGGRGLRGADARYGRGHASVEA